MGNSHHQVYRALTRSVHHGRRITVCSRNVVDLSSCSRQPQRNLTLPLFIQFQFQDLIVASTLCHTYWNISRTRSGNAAVTDRLRSLIPICYL